MLIECANAELAELLATHERTKKLCLRAGDKHLAVKENDEEAFRKALSISPDDSDTLNNYGWFLCQTKRERETIAAHHRPSARSSATACAASGVPQVQRLSATWARSAPSRRKAGWSSRRCAKAGLG